MSAAVAIAAMVSCNQKELNTPVEEYSDAECIEFIGTFEQPAGDQNVKTVLGGTDNHQVLWNKGDAIIIWDFAGKSEEFSARQAGEKSNFSPKTVEEEFVPENASYAFYPAKAVTGYDNGTVTFTIPATQNYAENSFGQDANFAVSIVQDGPEEAGKPTKLLPFTNVAGVLKIQLSCNNNSGTTKQIYVSRIVLKDKSQNICGTFSVDATAEKPSASYVEYGGKSITLNCNPAVALSTDASNPTPFLFTVPVGAIAQNSGFVAEVYNEYNHLVKVLKTSNKNGNATIKRSHITRMNNMECSWIPNECKEGLYLQSHLEQYFIKETGIYAYHGQIINTGVDPSLNGGIRIQARAKFDTYQGSTGNNPAICGLCNVLDETTFTPWISIDYHKNSNSARACFSSGEIIPHTGGNNDIFECDVMYSSSQYSATFNGTEYGPYDGRTLPDGTNFLLFASGRYQDAKYVENASSSSIYLFVMYRPDGTMIRNFVPVTREGVNGMWDAVEGVFYEPYKTQYTSGNFNIGDGPDI